MKKQKGFILIIFLLFLTGCTTFTPINKHLKGEPCTRHEDCIKGLACINGQCINVNNNTSITNNNDNKDVIQFSDMDTNHVEMTEVKINTKADSSIPHDIDNHEVDRDFKKDIHEVVNPCNTCAMNFCSYEIQNCQQDYSCSSLTKCMNACDKNNDYCQNNCIASYPKGFGKFMLMNICAYKYCKTTCNIQASPCDDCTITNCYYSIRDCYNNEECTEFLVCFWTQCSPDDQHCIQQCANKHQNGLSLLQNAFNCIQNNCRNLCNQ